MQQQWVVGCRAVAMDVDSAVPWRSWPGGLACQLLKVTKPVATTLTLVAIGAVALSTPSILRLAGASRMAFLGAACGLRHAELPVSSCHIRTSGSTDFLTAHKKRTAALLAGPACHGGRCHGSSHASSTMVLTAASGAGAQDLLGAEGMVQCLVTTPLDAFEVRMESWLLPASGEDAFLGAVEERHGAIRRELDDRRLRGYEKGIYLLFSAKCMVASAGVDGRPPPDTFCGECHTQRRMTSNTELGWFEYWEPEVLQGISLGECMASAPSGSSRHAPRCLEAVQRLKSWKICSVQPPAWSNSGGVSPLQ